MLHSARRVFSSAANNWECLLTSSAELYTKVFSHSVVIPWVRVAVSEFFKRVMVGIIVAVLSSTAGYFWTIRKLDRDLADFLKKGDTLIRQERYDEVRELSAILPEQVRNHKKVDLILAKAQIFKYAVEHDNFGILNLVELKKLKTKAESLDDQENTAETKALIGVVYSLLDEPGRATSLFKEAIKLEPRYANAYNFWAVTLMEWSAPEGAETWATASEQKLKEAIALAPQYEWPVINLGGLALRRANEPSASDYDSANKFFEQAESMAPRNPNTFMDSAVCLLNHGLLLKQADPTRANEYFGKASEKFRKASDLGLDSALFHNNWAYMFEATGNPDQALAHYDRALRIQPKFLRSCENRADLQEHVGANGQLIESYSRCLELAQELASHFRQRAADTSDALAADRLRSAETRMMEKVKGLQEKVDQLKNEKHAH